jgi:hypothetical protein
MLAVQVRDVLLHVIRVGVDLLPLGRRRRLQAGDTTLVGHGRIVSELDDVGRGRDVRLLRRRRPILGRLAAGQTERGCDDERRDSYGRAERAERAKTHICLSPVL